MFVRHSVHLNRQFGDCVQMLVAGHGRWFPGVLQEPIAGEPTLLAAVGLPVAGVALRKEVAVHLHEPGPDATRVSFTWRPTFPRRIFPEFEGSLEVAPIDPQTTRLTVSGTYVPPFGAVGRTLDEVVMHRAAEATVKDLAERIARELEIADAPRGVGS